MRNPALCTHVIVVSLNVMMEMKNLGQCKVVLGLLINIMMLFHCLELDVHGAEEEQFLSSQNLETEAVSSTLRTERRGRAD